jgi:putative transposase
MLGDPISKHYNSNMKKPEFVNDQIYHIYNRGVEKRKVFMDDNDYLRFVHDLFEFNDEQPVLSSNIRLCARKPSRAQESTASQCLEIGTPNIKRKRKLLVDILAFCLMPNHFHILLRQRVDNGVSKFMQKFLGYTMYFNEKYKRVGPLFQGKFKAVLVENEAHHLHIPNYIHLNPLGLLVSESRNTKINCEDALEFLKNYRWSSFRDYIGLKNFPSVTHREYLTEILGKPEDYAKEIKGWIKEINFNKPNDLLDDEDF